MGVLHMAVQLANVKLLEEAVRALDAGPTLAHCGGVPYAPQRLDMTIVFPPEIRNNGLLIYRSGSYCILTWKCGQNSDFRAVQSRL